MMKVVRPRRRRSSARLMRGFGLHVERAGGLVEDQDRRVLQDGAGDGDALALAARQRGAALADHELVAAGLAGDEIVRLGQPRRLLHLGVAGLGPADADVLGDRAVEQARVLEHHRDLVAQRVERHVLDVLAVDQDAARSGERRRCSSASVVVLPAPVGPTSAVVLPACGVEADAEHALVAVLEAEGHVLVAHLAGDVRQRHGVRLLAHALGGVEQVEEAAQGRGVLEDAHGEARQQVELADHHGGKADEGHDLADGDLPCARPARRRRHRWRPPRSWRRCASAP